MIDNLRILAALQLSGFARRLIGNRPVPEPEQIRRLRDALGEITGLLPAEHPACRVALQALGSNQEAPAR